MTTALIIAIILAACVIFALGVYHGQHHGREQRQQLLDEREQLHEALDDLGEMYDQHVARQFIPAMQEAIAAGLVGDDTFAMLHKHEGSRS